MRRALVLIVACVALLSVGLVAAQNNPASPTPSGTPERLCASPIAESSATPLIVSTAAAPAASPGGMGAGSPVGLYPCASPTSGTPAASSPAAVGTPPSIAMQDIKFSPKEVTIAANSDVTISLPNQGAAVHNFNIDELNIHSGDVQPGATASVKINAKPGDYQYYCAIPGHKEAGMVGVLHVK